MNDNYVDFKHTEEKLSADPEVLQHFKELEAEYAAVKNSINGRTFDSLLEKDGSFDEVTIKSIAHVIDSRDLLDRLLAIISIAHVLPKDFYDKQIKKLRDEAKKELDYFYDFPYTYNRDND